MHATIKNKRFSWKNVEMWLMTSHHEEAKRFTKNKWKRWLVAMCPTSSGELRWRRHATVEAGQLLWRVGWLRYVQWKRKGGCEGGFGRTDVLSF